MNTDKHFALMIFQRNETHLAKWTWFFFCFHSPHLTSMDATNVHCAETNLLMWNRFDASMKSAWQNVIETISEKYTPWRVFSNTFTHHLKARRWFFLGTMDEGTWSMAPKFKQISSQCGTFIIRCCRRRWCCRRRRHIIVNMLIFYIPFWMLEWKTSNVSKHV